jgi:DUF1365 family protein
LVASVYEVRNTFGDKHSYVVRMDDPPEPHRITKRLHVSPFMDMGQTYFFSMAKPGEHFALGITVSDEDGPIFRAGMSGDRLPFSDRTLARLFFTHPLVTFKSIGAIHWEALRLLIKGVGFRSRPAPSRPPHTIVTPEEASR